MVDEYICGDHKLSSKVDSKLLPDYTSSLTELSEMTEVFCILVVMVNAKVYTLVETR